MARVVHFEIHAAEPEKAIDFYQTVFGLGVHAAGTVSSMEYWTIKTGPDSERGINGGLVRRRGEIDGTAVIAFVCTVNVISVDSALESITKAGGTIALAKMAIPAIGWLAYGKDTQGNIFGVMQIDPEAK